MRAMVAVAATARSATCKRSICLGRITNRFPCAARLISFGSENAVHRWGNTKGYDQPRNHGPYIFSGTRLSRRRQMSSMAPRCIEHRNTYRGPGY
jgi:hypothetical protein